MNWNNCTATIALQIKRTSKAQIKATTTHIGENPHRWTPASTTIIKITIIDLYVWPLCDTVVLSTYSLMQDYFYHILMWSSDSKFSLNPEIFLFRSKSFLFPILWKYRLTFSFSKNLADMLLKWLEVTFDGFLLVVTCQNARTECKSIGNKSASHQSEHITILYYKIRPFGYLILYIWREKLTHLQIISCSWN